MVSLIPYTHHAAVIPAALTSCVNPEIRALHDEVKARGIVVPNGMGFDPGIYHLYAVNAIGEVHDNGSKVRAHAI